MVWCILLTVLAVILGIVSFVVFISFMFNGCSVSDLLIIAIMVVIAILLGWGANRIQENNTVCVSTVEEVVIIEKEIIPISSGNRYVIVVENKLENQFIVYVSQNQFLQNHIDDIVSIEIENTTVFGEEYGTIVKLKG